MRIIIDWRRCTSGAGKLYLRFAKPLHVRCAANYERQFLAACCYSQNRDLTCFSNCFLIESGSSFGANINQTNYCKRSIDGFSYIIWRRSFSSAVATANRIPIRLSPLKPRNNYGRKQFPGFPKCALPRNKTCCSSSGIRSSATGSP